MLSGAVAKKIISNLQEKQLLTHWHRLATDMVSDENDNFWCVLVTYVDNDAALIASSLFDMSNIISGSTAQQMWDVCNEVREAFALD